MEGYCNELNWPPADIMDGDPNTFWRADPKLATTPQNPQWIQWRYHEPLAACAIHLVPSLPEGPRLRSFRRPMMVGCSARWRHSRCRRGRRSAWTSRRPLPSIFRLLIKSAHAPDVQLAEGWLLREGDEPWSRPGHQMVVVQVRKPALLDYPKEGPACLEEEYPDDGVFDARKDEVVDLTFTHGRGWSPGMGDPARAMDDPALRLHLAGSENSPKYLRAPAVMKRTSWMRGELTGTSRYAAEPILRAAGKEVGRTVQFLHVDSYEIGADIQGLQPTWSVRFRDEFKARCGYDLLPYLPALAGRILDSREQTDRFLWDIRHTIADLMAEQYYGRFAELCHARGLGFHTEAALRLPRFPHIDILRCMGIDDIPMGEFWHATDLVSQVDFFCNVIRSVASAAHTYGKRIAQAEAFTTWANWQEYPAALKAEGDRAFCDGLNRNVLMFLRPPALAQGKTGHRVDRRGHEFRLQHYLVGARAGHGSDIWPAANTSFSREVSTPMSATFTGKARRGSSRGGNFCSPLCRRATTTTASTLRCCSAACRCGKPGCCCPTA